MLIYKNNTIDEWKIYGLDAESRRGNGKYLYVEKLKVESLRLKVETSKLFILQS